MRSDATAGICAIFNAPNRAVFDALLAQTVQAAAKIASKLATWLEASISEGLTVFAFFSSHH